MTPLLFMILAMLLAAGMSLTVAIIVLRSEMPKKPLWAIISLFGAWTCSTWWDAGDLVRLRVELRSIEPLSIGFEGWAAPLSCFLVPMDYLV